MNRKQHTKKMVVFFLNKSDKGITGPFNVKYPEQNAV